MPERRIYSRLVATTAVTDLVGTNIKPITQLQGASLPLITWQRITTETINHSTGATTTENARIQINSYAETYDDAKTLGRAVKAALSGWGSSTANPQISMTHIESDADLPDGPEPGEDSFVNGVTQDYLLWYSTT